MCESLPVRLFSVKLNFIKVFLCSYMQHHTNDITSQITINWAKVCENFNELRKETTEELPTLQLSVDATRHL
jgi:hypothetical protein